MKLTIKDTKGNNQGELEVKFPLIEDGKGTQAVHDTVVAYQAAQRMGTACTKNVGEVAGTNKKPWRQKGTGRARAGSFQSPLWRGGGVVFGPKPRDFSKKVSRKTRQLALRKALSERLRAGDVMLVENGCVHQHFNDDEKESCILLVFKAKPLFLFMHLLFQKMVEWPTDKLPPGVKEFHPPTEI
jgi:50S ribosomal protein L4